MERPPTPAWLLVFFSNMFFGCTGFSIVLPTLWPYLRELNASTHFLACAVAAYSVGEGCGGWAMGKLYARWPERPKVLLQCGMLLGFSASVLYVVAPAFGEDAAPVVILLARFASGFDNGNRQTVEQTFISTRVPARHQTAVSSRLSSCAITGIMMGPAFGAPLQAMQFRLPLLGIMVDGNNGPGLVLAVVCLMNVLVTSLFFDPKSDGKAHIQGTVGVDLTSEPAPKRAGLTICYVIFFAVNLSMASLETVTPIVAQELYGWGPCRDPTKCDFKPAQTYVNLLMSSGGALSLTMAILLSFILGPLIYRREVIAISLGLTVQAVANLSNVDWGGYLPASRFAVDYLLGAFFGGLIRGPNISLMSQIIGPHPKAEYMGLLFAVGAVPRVLGPFLFVNLLALPQPVRMASFEQVYEGPVPRTWLLYGSQAAIFLLIVVAMQWFRNQMKPHASNGHTGSPVVSNMKTPLLQESDETPHISFLPSTPVGVREGIGDFERLLTRSVSSRSLRSSP